VKGKIHIEGNGIRKHWAEKAIMRAGYISSELNTMPYIEITSSKNGEYKLITSTGAKEFSSIYELLGNLPECNILPI
jgi:hypothetical protein